MSAELLREELNRKLGPLEKPELLVNHDIVTNGNSKLRGDLCNVSNVSIFRVREKN